MGLGAIMKVLEERSTGRVEEAVSARLPITIGIDSGPLFGDGGISEYVRPMVRTLLSMDTVSRYRLCLRRSWFSDSALATLNQLAPVDVCHVPDRVLSWWWKHRGTPFPVNGALWKDVDVFLATCFMAPILAKGKVVSVVYDLIPLLLPEYFPSHREFRMRLEDTIARSEALISISQRTKLDLMEILGVDEAKIHVIPPGSDALFGSMETETGLSIRQRYGISEPYLLYVGSTGPHKNVENLVRAYDQACRQGGLSLSLVLVLRDRGNDRVRQLLDSLSPRLKVLCLPKIPREDLPALYAGATFFVWPSLYEGFGLPVLESMTCGTPVLLGRRGGSPEIVKHCGWYVDVENPTSMAEGLCAFAGRREQLERLREECRLRAADFTWVRSAETLRNLLYAVAEEVA